MASNLPTAMVCLGPRLGGSRGFSDTMATSSSLGWVVSLLPEFEL